MLYHPVLCKNVGWDKFIRGYFHEYTNNCPVEFQYDLIKFTVRWKFLTIQMNYNDFIFVFWCYFASQIPIMKWKVEFVPHLITWICLFWYYIVIHNKKDNVHMNVFQDLNERISLHSSPWNVIPDISRFNFMWRKRHEKDVLSW